MQRTGAVGIVPSNYIAASEAPSEASVEGEGEGAGEDGYGSDADQRWMAILDYDGSDEEEVTVETGELLLDVLFDEDWSLVSSNPKPHPTRVPIHKRPSSPSATSRRGHSVRAD